jgi:hypothetical protein
MIPLVGAFLIGGAIWGASHFVFARSWAEQRHADETALLDSMQEDAQAVTPVGLHEVRLRRYECGAMGDDSAPLAIERTLRIDGKHQPGAIRTAVLDGYVKRGWHRVTFAFAVSKDTVEHGDRSLYAEESDDGRVLTVALQGGGFCAGLGETP